MVARAPFTTGLVTVLFGTTVVLRRLVNSQATDVMRWASTNIQNLTHAPIRAFVASAVVLPDGAWLPYAIALPLSLGVLERRVGTLRAVGVFGAGHVIATILTEGAVWYWYGVEQGGLPEAVRDQLDVGVSYGLWASVAAALFYAPRWLKLPGAIGLSGYMLFELWTQPGMTSSGHVLATAIGFGAWTYLSRRRVMQVTSTLGS